MSWQKWLLVGAGGITVVVLAAVIHGRKKAEWEQAFEQQQRRYHETLLRSGLTYLQPGYDYGSDVRGNKPEKGDLGYNIVEGDRK